MIITSVLSEYVYVERITGQDGGTYLINAANPAVAQAATAVHTVLSQDPDGFFIMIERGDIDWANFTKDYMRINPAMTHGKGDLPILHNHLPSLNSSINFSIFNNLLPVDEYCLYSRRGFTGFGKSIVVANIFPIEKSDVGG